MSVVIQLAAMALICAICLVGCGKREDRIYPDEDQQISAERCRQAGMEPIAKHVPLQPGKFEIMCLPPGVRVVD